MSGTSKTPDSFPTDPPGSGGAGDDWKAAAFGDPPGAGSPVIVPPAPPEMGEPPPVAPAPVAAAVESPAPPLRIDVVPGRVEPLELESLVDDEAFSLRRVGDIAGLAVSIARVGQRTPIDVRLVPGTDGNGVARYQVICGFRRVAALRMLKRDMVVAWVHPNLSDDEALVHAVASAAEERGLATPEIERLFERLEREGRLGSQVKALLDAALTPPGSDLAADEAGEAVEEVDLDELSSSLLSRLNDISSDLVLLSEVWTSLDGDQRTVLLDQLRYQSELHAYLLRRG